MAVEVRQTGNVDGGTGFTSQRDEPVTVTVAGSEAKPTGFAEQQPAEVTYTDDTHLGKPTGTADVAGETTTVDATYAAIQEREEAERKRRAAAHTKKRTAKNKGA